MYDDNYNDRNEETTSEELSTEKKEDTDRDSDNADEKNKEFEDVCFICRRPESKTGKMFRLPNHICVCNDCMHKTMDTVSQFDYQGMLNQMDPTDYNNNGKGFPNISFVNLADLQGDGGIPNKQKLKKKKK
jgi:ATP-dependent Clp protease ATP-binding subunit ClpX